MPSKKYKKTKIFNPKSSSKKSLGRRSYSNFNVKKGNPRRSMLRHNQSEGAPRFFGRNMSKDKDQEMSIPDVVNRLYLINVEAAQNQVNLKSQIHTTTELNKNFQQNFKQRNIGPSNNH